MYGWIDLYGPRHHFPTRWTGVKQTAAEDLAAALRATGKTTKAPKPCRVHVRAPLGRGGDLRLFGYVHLGDGGRLWTTGPHKEALADEVARVLTPRR